MNRRARRASGKAGTANVEPALDSLSALRARALELYQSGRLREAERAYEQLLQKWPADVGTLYQYGVLKGQLGGLEAAAMLLGKAAAIQPREAAIHHALGLVHAQQRRFADAIAAHDRVLALEPRHFPALLARGEALHQLGDISGAWMSYRRAAEIAPTSWEARFNLATAAADLGRFAESVQAYRELTRLHPNSAEAHFNLGCVLRDLGQHAEAARHFDRAVALKPEVDRMLIDLVAALCAIGRVDDALDRSMAAMRRNPETAGARLAFATAMTHAGELDYRPELARALAQCLSSEDVEQEDLAAAAGRQIVLAYRLAPAPEEAAGSAVASALASDGAEGCLADPLLHLLLARAVNYDLVLERFLTHVRRRLALAETVPQGLHRFLEALALQVFNNGYIFSPSEEETHRADMLKAQIEVSLSTATALDPGLTLSVLLFALYRPLMEIGGANRLAMLAAKHGSGGFRLLVQRCIEEPLEEARLARDVPSLGAIADPVSRAVQAQYEEHPYPRWFGTPPLAPVALPVMLCRKFPHLEFPRALVGPIEILVAGCGTGRQPIGSALSFADARVLGVDLSRASLAYACRMAKRLGVSNVSLMQADLLDLAGLGRQFPIIEAVGVLHHMAEPMAGWRTLSDLLVPGGFMRIGLYSAIARADVAAARQLIAELGLGHRAEDIRSFRQRVLFGEDAPRFRNLARSKDMFDLNGCRDLLFHAKEHRYTLLEIREMLARLGLEFVGFEHADKAVPARYLAGHPQDVAMTDLVQWSRFEEAHRDAFAGMYVFWCRKPPAAPND